MNRGLADSLTRSPLGLLLLQVLSLNAVQKISPLLPVVAFARNLSQSFPSLTFTVLRRRAWLTAPAAADLLEVFDLPS
jgi:hypothetical protein